MTRTKPLPTVVQSTDTGAPDSCPAKRDPETLIGPLLWLLTRLARVATSGDAAADDVSSALVAHLTALAAHPSVALHLRLAAGALAIEHRQGIGRAPAFAAAADLAAGGDCGSR